MLISRRRYAANVTIVMKVSLAIAIIIGAIWIVGAVLISRVNAAELRADISTFDMTPYGQGVVSAVGFGTTNDFYVAYGVSGQSISLYHFNSQRQLVSQSAIEHCDPSNTGAVYVDQIVVSTAGSVFVSVYDESYSGDKGCVQKFDSTGTPSSSFALRQSQSWRVGALLVSPSDKLYVGSYRSDNAQIKHYLDEYDINGTHIRAIGESGVVNGPLGEGYISSLGYYNDELYVVTSAGTSNTIKKYDSAGANGSTISTSYGDSITIDPYGRMFMVGSSIFLLNDDGSSQTSVTAGSSIDFAAKHSVDPLGRGGVAYYQGDTAGLISFVTLDEGLRFQPHVAINTVDDTTVGFTVEHNANEPEINASVTVSYWVRNAETLEVEASGVLPYTGQATSLSASTLMPGTEYLLEVGLQKIGFNEINSTETSFRTTGTAPLTTVSRVSFNETDEDQKSMTIEGVKFGQYLDALQRSLVTLNGTPLAFCSEKMGLPYELLQTLVASEELVTDTRPCYMILENNATVMHTQTQTIVLLPSDFDMTAPGSVAVNGSPVFQFNSAETPVVPQPIAVLPSGLPLTGTPQIAAMPTFKGTAEPGTLVTLTIHSDPVTCSTTADTNGDWSCTFAQALPAGAHTLYLRFVEPGQDGRTIEQGPYPVTVAQTSSNSGGEVSTNTNRGSVSSRGNLAQVNPDGSLEVVDIDDQTTIDADLPRVVPPSETDEEAASTEVVESAPSFAWLWWTLAGIALLAIVIAAITSSRKKSV